MTALATRPGPIGRSADLHEAGGEMIHEVDRSLAALLQRDALNGSDVEVEFDAPTKEWAARKNAPTINLFLYDIREDVKRRDLSWREIRDDSGRVVERRQPVRRFKLSYLITAWTQRPDDEHRLLSQLLAGLLQHDEIPEELLEGDLADEPVPVILDMALPPSQERSLSDVWTALGGELKPSLDLNVTAPIEPGRQYETGPPVLEEPQVRMQVSPDPDDSGDEAIQAGTDKEPGRTIQLRRIARKTSP